MTADTPNLPPSTAWAFGPGRAHDFFATRMARKPHHLTGVLERAAGHTVTASPALLGNEVLLAPTLWAGLPNPRFLPFILGNAATQAEVSTVTAQALDGFWSGIGQAGVTTPGGGGMGPKAAPEALMTSGFPLRQDTIDFTASGIATIDKANGIDPAKPLIVVGIIDDGIPFAHKAFDAADGTTRVESAWVMGVPGDGSGAQRFGREITRKTIMDLRATHGADEDAIYRAAGVLGGVTRPSSPLSFDTSHGAHTLGALAADQDAQVRIIAVDLPPAATWDTSGYGKDMLLISALHHIFDRADKLAAAHGHSTLPMVLNLSYGYSGGAHDGNGTVESAMDELIMARRAVAPTALTMPSGNMFQSRTHAQLSASEAKKLPWRVPPDDRTSSFLECWLPAGAQIAGMNLTLTPPTTASNGNPVTFAGADAMAGQTSTKPILINGAQVGQITADLTRGGRWRIMIAIAPTESSSPNAAPSGIWHLELAGSDALLWIQRDISYGGGNTGARQSYFDDPDYVLFDEQGRSAVLDQATSLTKRYGTLNGMATGTSPLVTGAGKGWGDGAELYSAAASPSNMACKVDVSVMIAANAAEMGRTGLTNRSGGSARMNGTSAAAPAIGNALASLIAEAQAQDADSAYFATLDRSGRLSATTKEQGRLGEAMLNE